MASVTIPDSVIRIGESAFSGCSSLVSVTIPDSVTTIDENAFNGCSSLQTIICKPTTPPILGGMAFGGIPSDATIIIPEGCEEAYTSSDWIKAL